MSASTALSAALAPASALVQPDGWGGGWGWGSMMMFGPFMMILFIAAIVVVVVVVLRRLDSGSLDSLGSLFSKKPQAPGSEALKILQERFAKGEIDKDEFEERKRLLSE